MEVWTLAWDTDSGTGASVHLTERECFEELIRDYVDLEKQDEAKKELDLDGTVDEAGEHDFWEWFDDNGREPMDTFNIEGHNLAIAPDLVEAAAGDKCSGCGRDSIACSVDPCPGVIADREEATDPKEAALAAAAEAQRVYWDALVDLETALGFEIDSESEIDYSNVTVESLKEDYGE